MVEREVDDNVEVLEDVDVDEVEVLEVEVLVLEDVDEVDVEVEVEVLVEVEVEVLVDVDVLVGTVVLTDVDMLVDVDEVDVMLVVLVVLVAPPIPLAWTTNDNPIIARTAMLNTIPTLLIDMYAPLIMLSGTVKILKCCCHIQAGQNKKGR